MLRQAAAQEDPTRLDLRQARLDGVLVLSYDGEHLSCVGAVIDLSGCKADTLRDSPQAWGDDATEWKLDGFQYESIADGSPIAWHERSAWLAKMPPGETLTTQPYRHLASVLQRQGHPTIAREVRIALEHERHARAKSWKWLLGFLHRYATAYGYKPWMSIGWMVLLLVNGWVIFGTWHGLMSPASGDVLVTRMSENPEQRSLPPEYPKFSPCVYSLDSMLPLVNLHQEEYWLPDAGKGTVQAREPLHLGFITSGRLLRWYHWFHIGMGWTLSTMAAVGFIGVMTRSKDEEQA